MSPTKKEHTPNGPRPEHWGAEDEGLSSSSADEQPDYWGEEAPFTVRTHEVPSSSMELIAEGIELPLGSKVKRIVAKTRGDGWTPFIIVASILVLMTLALVLT